MMLMKWTGEAVGVPETTRREMEGLDRREQE